MPTPPNSRKLNLLSNGAVDSFWDARRRELLGRSVARAMAVFVIISSSTPCVTHCPTLFSSSWVHLSPHALLIRRHTSIEIAKYVLPIVHVLIAPVNVWVSFFILINFDTIC